MANRFKAGWGLSVTVVALISILVASGFAVAGAKNPIAKGTIYACVTKDFGTLNLSSAKAKCPSGQRKIAWNARGKRGQKGRQGTAGRPGKTGPTGNQGIAGTQGAAGQAGEKGQTGATGATGPEGPQGPKGSPGQDGSNGEDGPPGLPGEPGPPGVQGEPGEPGPQGPPGPTALTASGPVELVTDGTPIIRTVSALPLVGMAGSSASMSGSHLLSIPPGSETMKRVQLFPHDGIITSISARFTTNVATSLASSHSVRLSIYTAEDPGDPFTEVPESICPIQFSPGPIPVGQILSAECPLLSIPIAAGTTGIVAAYLAVEGPTGPTAILGHLTTSIRFA